MLCLLTLGCKDNVQKTAVQKPVTDTVVQEEQKLRWDSEQYYKPRISNEGDTLLPKIPQDSVAVYFRRYARENDERYIHLNTSYGTIKIRLFEQPAMYRGNFLFLVKNGYFDTTQFYRVAENFVVQAGMSDNPQTTLLRNSAGNYLLPPELENSRKHSKGMVSMARKYEQNPLKLMDPFAFFICMKDLPHLDGEHVIVGEVVEGMNVTEAISQVKTDEQDWPLENIPVSMTAVKM
jgi:peptidylprolyl isomerase